MPRHEESHEQISPSEEDRYREIASAWCAVDPKSGLSRVDRFIHTETLSKVLMVSPLLYSLFKPALDQRVAAEAEKVCRHIANREITTAKNMIKLNPRLLDVSATIYDKNGRKLIGVPFDHMLAGRHYELASWVIASGLMDKKKWAEQFKKRFPNDYDFNTHKFYDFDRLIHDLAKDPCTGGLASEETQKTIQAFQDIVKPKSTDDFTIGNVFDMQLAIDAAEAYFKSYKILNDEQRKWYCQQVMGYLQGLYTGDDAGRCCTGYYYTAQSMDVPDGLMLQDGTPYLLHPPLLDLDPFINVFGVRDTLLLLEEEGPASLPATLYLAMLKDTVSKMQNHWQDLSDQCSKILSESHVPAIKL